MKKSHGPALTIAMIAAVIASTLASAPGHASSVRPCAKLLPGTSRCVLVPFDVWYCRGLLEPARIVLTHPEAPGPSCVRGIAWYERYSR
jgi:hypothetical protein